MYYFNYIFHKLSVLPWHWTVQPIACHSTNTILAHIDNVHHHHLSWVRLW